MQQPPSILVYGREPGLLQSRSWILQAAGFQVYSAGHLAEGQRIAATWPIDLLVLCHTLSREEWRDAIAWADKLPDMNRIVLLPAGAPCSDLPNEEVLNQFAGPREMIAAAHRLLPAGQPV